MSVSDDWGLGSYEETAQELEPAAEAAIAALELEPGERVLDVACGSGNAALLAARAGAQASGLDASPRLIEVARERVPDGHFVLGDAIALPYEDGFFDAAVSVFGVIFVSPAERAAGELARVVRAGGRVVITTWPPRGPVFEVVVLMREALARVRSTREEPDPNWGEDEVLRRLLGPFGVLEVAERELIYDVSDTPEQLWKRWERAHPMWIGARAELEPDGEWERLREASIAVLEDARRDGPPASPYLLARLTRG